jgi:hypothetical protein
MVITTITEAERVAAIDRALRMAVLFQKTAFQPMMNILYDTTNSEAKKKDNFVQFCKNHGLTDEDIEDLWKYLKHYRRRPGGGPDVGW